MPNNDLHATQPLISFIIPAYNAGSDAIQSLVCNIGQAVGGMCTYEVIVVDDGSLHPITAEGCTIIRTTHQGVSHARNTALDHAQGQYIQFIDADDRLIPETYPHIIQMIGQTNATMIVFTPRLQPHVSPTTGIDYMRHHNLHGAVWNYIARHDSIGTLRFDTGTQYAEDEEFTALLTLRQQRLYVSHQPVYQYHTTATSVTNRRDPDSIRRRLADTHAVILRLQTHLPRLDTEAQQALSRRIHQLTTDYIYQTLRLSVGHHSPSSILKIHTILAPTLRTLRREGLYPLPIRTYTMPYFLASLMSHTIR